MGIWKKDKKQMGTYMNGGSEGKKGDGTLKERPERVGVRRGPNRFEERREREKKKGKKG